MKELHIYCDICKTELEIDAGHYIGTELKMNGVDSSPMKFGLVGNAPAPSVGVIKIESDLCPACSRHIRDHINKLTATCVN